MSEPIVISFTAIAAVSGAATGVPGTQTLTLYNYATELNAINAEMAIISTALTGIGAAVGILSTELAKLQEYLLAVQSPSGDFRTVSPEDAPNTIMVSSALASNVPPIVVTPEATT